MTKIYSKRSVQTSWDAGTLGVIGSFERQDMFCAQDTRTRNENSSRLFRCFPLWAAAFMAIAPECSLNAGLLVHYALDGNANDVVGDRDGTLFGAPTFSGNVPGPLTGFSTSSILLDGVVDRLGFDVPQGDTLSGTFSVAAWVNVQEFRNSSTHVVFGTRGPSDGSFDLQMGPFKRIRVDLGSGASIETIYDTPAVSYNLDEWHHVAVAVSPGSFDVYFDGGFVGLGSGPNNPLLWDQNHDIAVGSAEAQSGSVGYSFKGYIDDVRIYDHRLSSGEVADLYSGVPEPGSLAVLACLGLGGVAAFRRIKR